MATTVEELDGSEHDEVLDGINEIWYYQDPCPEIQFVLYSQLSGGEITAYDDDDGFEAWATVSGWEISINAGMLTGSVSHEDMGVMLVHEARHNRGEEHELYGTYTDNDALSYMCVGIA